MSNRTAASGQNLPSTKVQLTPAGVPQTVKVSHGSGNTCIVYGDNAIWDSTANVFVNVDNTTVGTTLCPKL